MAHCLASDLLLLELPTAHLCVHVSDAQISAISYWTSDLRPTMYIPLSSTTSCSESLEGNGNFVDPGARVGAMCMCTNGGMEEQTDALRQV